tara:strand:- start:36 stop:176 length:141 start_codon:yes stop_codon:yes gene_type:complete
MKRLKFKRLMITLLAILGGAVLLQYAYAQSSGNISLNSPVAFPVDI